MYLTIPCLETRTDSIFTMAGNGRKLIGSACCQPPELRVKHLIYFHYKSILFYTRVGVSCTDPSCTTTPACAWCNVGRYGHNQGAPQVHIHLSTHVRYTRRVPFPHCICWKYCSTARSHHSHLRKKSLSSVPGVIYSIIACKCASHRCNITITKVKSL